MKKITLGIFFAIAFTSLAHAEVMDKELSVPEIWGVAVICSFLGFAAARFKPILIIGTGVVAGLFLGGVITEINNPIVGKAIITEAGLSYPRHAYAAIAVVVISHVVGFALRKCSQAKADR